MIVKDLFVQCPIDSIVSELMLLYRADESRRETIFQVHHALLEDLKEKPPCETGYLILGISYYEEGREYLNPTLFEIRGLSESIDNIQLFDVKNVEELSLEEIDRLQSKLKLPQSFAYELSPWDEILGFEVDTWNVEDVGAAKLAADILYDMTFYGFTEETVSAERKKLDEAIRKMEEGKHFYSADEVFWDLSWKDTRTEAEKQKERLADARESLKNRIHTARVLKNYSNRTSSFNTSDDI